MTEPTTPPERETRLVDVKGRMIVVRQLVDAQMLYMAREAKLLRNADTSVERKMEGMVDLFDILESAVVQDLDRAYMLDLVKKGELGLRDLLGFVSAFDEDEDEPKPKVRRGRPPAKRS